jgi:hypothetical protein
VGSQDAPVMTRAEYSLSLTTELREHADRLELLASMLQEIVVLANEAIEMITRRTSDLAENVYHVGTHSNRMN